jgi:hypothetical protein
MARFATLEWQDSNATIGKGSVSQDKDSSRTHVGPQTIAWGPQWHITSSGKIITALFVTLRHIREDIQFPEKCLILTDSLGSVKFEIFLKNFSYKKISFYLRVRLYDEVGTISDFVVIFH